ncbi:MAG: hypothetical protein RLZ87_1097 [Armatimonadota bacterium]
MNALECLLPIINRMFVSGLAVGVLGNAGFFRGGQLVALPKIQGLPAPHPFAISADGRTVIGQFAPGNPFVWKGRSIVQFKPFKDVFAHFVQGVSADGSTIVGKANAGFIWKLGKSKSLPNKGTFCVGVSGDGRVVVGQEEWQEPLGSEGSVTNQRLKARGLRRGFIWKGDAIEVIPEFAPLCISLDGKVIAGVHTEGEKTSAYVRSAKQVTALPVPTETSDSVAYAINRDGARKVGCVTLESGSTQGILWKGSDKFVLLQNRGASFAVAKTVTPDGSWIGGFAGDDAAIWESDGKVRSVASLLQSAKVATAGWKFESVNGITRVGNKLSFVGWGHRNGMEAGYFATVELVR